jgi:hypothetical protein
MHEALGFVPRTAGGKTQQVSHEYSKVKNYL